GAKIHAAARNEAVVVAAMKSHAKRCSRYSFHISARITALPPAAPRARNRRPRGTKAFLQNRRMCLWTEACPRHLDSDSGRSLPTVFPCRFFAEPFPDPLRPAVDLRTAVEGE